MLIVESPVTVKMRIRHYFGNNSQNSSSDRPRQVEDLQSEKDSEFDNQKSPIPGTIKDKV